ncbi:MAG: response regulator [Candidatus Berkelbacteria bacterium]
MLNDKVILVVDDDPTLLEMYVERFKASGAIVIKAVNGEDAITQIKENHPVCVLLDVMMPKVNGFDVLKEIRGNSDTAQTPIIVLTALNDDVKRKMAMDLGANDFICKAESLPSDVVAKVEKFVK